MDNSISWRDLALQVYRLAKAELDEWKKHDRDDLDYWREELEEALLDLKQATIDDQQVRAIEYIQETLSILFELRRRL